MSDYNKGTKTGYVIDYPIAIKVVFIACILLFGTGLVFSMIARAGLVCYLIFGVLILLGVYGTLASVMWKIKVDGEDICYCGILGSRHKYTFADITKAVEFNHLGNNAISCYAGETKMFTIDNNIAGYYQFLVDLRIHRIIVDKTKRRKNDPMNKYEDMIDGK